MSIKDISQLKMCASPLVLTKQQRNIITSDLPGSKKLQILRAVSLKGTIWPDRSIIYVDYIGNVPENIEVTPEENFSKYLLYTGDDKLTDYNPQCSAWASKIQSECELNPDYMLTNCALSCSNAGYTPRKSKLFSFLSFLGPDNERLDAPYRDVNGNMIDSQNNPLLFDPLEKKCRDRIQSAKAQGKIDLAVKQSIEEIVLTRLQPYINLTFIFGKNPRTAVGDIRITFDISGGSWSAAGTDCSKINRNEATMNFGWFDVKTIIHEFGHALGMMHEHKRPDRDSQLLFNEPLLYKWGEIVLGDANAVKWNIIDKLGEDEINDITFLKNKNKKVNPMIMEYDPKSIMLYFYPAIVTLNPQTGKPPGQGSAQNVRLSKKDVLYLNALYPGNAANNKNRITPEKFYFDVYGEHIETPVKNKITIIFKTTNSPGAQTKSQIIIYMFDKNNKLFTKKIDNVGKEYTCDITSPNFDINTLKKPIRIFLNGNDNWNIEKISFYFNNVFFKQYTPNIWLGNNKGSVRYIDLKNNYGISSKENFELGFNTNDKTGFGVTIGLIVVGVILLICILYLIITRFKK